MAGLGQEAVVPLRPELLNIRPLDFSVQENAVARMTDAFRKGQIEANDVIERYSVLNKTKEKVAIQNLDEFISPQAIAQRQNAAQAANVENELKLNPLYAQAQEAKMQETINAAQGGSYIDMIKVAATQGLFPKNRDATWTEARQQEALDLFGKSQRFAKYSASAKQNSGDWKANLEPVAESKQVFDQATGKYSQQETKKIPTGDQIQVFDKNGSFIPTQAKLYADSAAMDSAQDWINKGEPSYNPFSSLVEGRVAETPVTARATQQQQSVKESIEVNQTKTSPTGEKVETNTKTNFRAPPGGERIVESKTVEDPTKKANESQTKAILAVPGVVSAETNMDALKTMGWDNTTWGAAGWSIAAAVLPGVVEKPLETAGRKLFENAVSSFKEGMLRLSSGGAITEPEHVNYREMYFPMPRDPIQLVQSKEKLRAEMGEMVAKLATQNLHTPEKGSIEEKNIQAIHARALRAQSGVGATPASTGPTERGAWDKKIIDLPGVGRGYYDAATKKFHSVQ